MSRRTHPIDHIFKKKLRHYTSETPLHLWERIEYERQARLKMAQRDRRRYLVAALLLIGVTAGVMSWFTKNFPDSSALGAFPIAYDQPASFTEVCDEAVLPIATNVATFAPIVQTLKPAESSPVLTVEKPAEILLTPEIEHTAPQMTLASNDVAENTSIQMLPLLPGVTHPRRAAPVSVSGCASFGNGKTKFYLDLMTAPGLAARSLYPRGKDYEDYADTRRRTELPRYAYSAAARLSLVTESGLAFRSGVNYSEINERFQHTIENEVRIIITNIYGQNGDIIGTDTTIEQTARQLVANNRYRTLDIPVVVGFERNFKNMTLTVNGGAYVNVLFRPQGEFLSPEDNRPVVFSNDLQNESYPAFRENLGIGWYGSIGVQYRLNPRMQVLVEPHLKAYPRSFTRDDFMTDQKYLTAGVFVGIRHQFSL